MERLREMALAAYDRSLSAICLPCYPLEAHLSDAVA
jgi:hypothetical protein